MTFSINRNIIFILAIAAVTWLVAACSVSDSGPGELDASELAQYSVLIQGLDAIYQWDGATGERYLLAGETLPDVNAVASSSGTYVAYGRRTEGEVPGIGHTRLYVMNTVSGDEIALETALLTYSNTMMAWSPDETKLLVTAQKSASPYDFLLMLVSIPDGEITVLDTHSYRITGPHWHPDSDRFSFMRFYSNASFSSATGYLSSVSGEPEAVTEGRIMLSNLQFSPDGRFVAFHELADSGHYLSTLLLENSSHRKRVKMRVFEPPQTGGMPTFFGPHDASGHNLVWIPESVNQLAFVNYKPGHKNEWYTYSSPANSSSPLHIESDTFLRTKPAFSPDGNFWISYQRMNVNEPVSQSAVVVTERRTGRVLKLENAPSNINSLQLVPK